MPIELKMPALSPTMEEGTLAKWLVKEGDDVKSGDILAEIETDKATMEFEAVDEGKIAKILVPEGTDGVKVGQPIALLSGDGEAAGEAAPAEAPKPAMKAEPSVPAPESQQAEATPTPHVFETAARDLVADVAHTRDEPEVPEGTPLVSTTVREALRDAMAEEMRRDERVFVMGEEVAEYQGAYKVTQNLLQEFGPRRVVDTPITEYGFAGVGTAQRLAWPPSTARITAAGTRMFQASSSSARTVRRTRRACSRPRSGPTTRSSSSRTSCSTASISTCRSSTITSCPSARPASYVPART